MNAARRIIASRHALPPAPASEPVSTPAIDLDVLGRFTLGNRALEVEVLNLFADHLPITLALLDPTNAESWKYATHTLKGAARSVGATRLAAIAATAEHAPHDKRPALVAEIEAETQAATDFVRAFAALAD